jgi:hypothetical protein
VAKTNRKVAINTRLQRNRGVAKSRRVKLRLTSLVGNLGFISNFWPPSAQDGVQVLCEGFA